MLSRNCVFTEMDIDLLALYCEAFADLLRARKDIDENGDTFPSPNGHKTVSPYVAIRNQSDKTMRDIMNVFGMGPAYRTRIKVDAQASHGKKTAKGGLLD